MNAALTACHDTATATLGPTQEAKLLGASKNMIYYMTRELNNASR